MLPDDAFLRRLPTLLNPMQIVQLEALVFSADAVEASLDVIRQVTTHYRERLGEAGRKITVGLLMHAWTIVDSVHVVRQVLTALDYKTPLAVDFQKKYDWLVYSETRWITSQRTLGTSVARRGGRQSLACSPTSVYLMRR